MGEGLPIIISTVQEGFITGLNRLCPIRDETTRVYRKDSKNLNLRSSIFSQEQRVVL